MQTVMGARRYRLQKQRLEVKTAPRSHSLVWTGLTAAVALALVAMTYVYLRSVTEKMNRELQHKRQECQVKNKEIENQRMDIESLRSGRHILAAVQRMGMELRAPLPGQVRRILLVNGHSRTEFSAEGLTPGAGDEESVVRRETSGPDIAYT